MSFFNKSEYEEFILNNKVIGFFDKPIKLKSGRLSDFYINFRNVSSDCYLIDILSDFVISFVKDLNLEFDCFYGVPEGATKLAIISQYKFAKIQPDFKSKKYILPMGRGKIKEHGDYKDRFFIGIPNGKVIILEDVTTTGSSLIETIDILNNLELEIVSAISLCNRNEIREDGKLVKQKIEEKGVLYYTLVNSLELLPKAFKRYNVSSDIIQKVSEYYKKYGEKELEY